jgi:hypothetical protein
MKPSNILISTVPIILLLTTYTAHAQEPLESRVGIFYDSTQPAHLLWPYTFRVMVVEDLVGSGWQCWKTYPNGSHLIDPERCRPMAGVKLRIWYTELKESSEVQTNSDGIATVSKWRLFSYPYATFRVEARLGEDIVIREFRVYPQFWSLASITSFAAMLSAMILTLRRGLW